MVQNQECMPAYYRVSVKARIRKGGKIVLVREDGKKWDLPGGGVEHQETIFEGLKRELGEEIGLTALEVKGEPRIFKMVDPRKGRPLLFLAYEVGLDDEVVLTPGDNVEIGYFAEDEMPEVVQYAEEYAEFIRSGK